MYHQPGIDLLFKVVPVDNILFASEMVGAVKGNDPKTGFGFDDTKRYVEGTSLSAADKAKVFEGNARKVYPRINKKLSLAPLMPANAGIQLSLLGSGSPLSRGRGSVGGERNDR